MPTRRAFVAAMIPAVVVGGIFWRWLDFPALLAIGLGVLFGVGGLLVTRSVYDEAVEELEAWRRAAPDLAELDRRPAESQAPAPEDPVRHGRWSA
jgi:hypothetical protein